MGAGVCTSRKGNYHRVIARDISRLGDANSNIDLRWNTVTRPDFRLDPVNRLWRERSRHTGTLGATARAREQHEDRYEQ